MKQKTSLRPLALLLLLAVLTLSGCGLDGGTLTGRVLPVLTALNLPEETLTELPQLVEAVDQTANGESAALMISETAGDGTLLYIVYAIIVPETWEQLLGNATFRLRFDLQCSYADPARGSTGVRELFNLPRRYDPRLHTLYYVAAYTFSEPYTGQELSLQVEGLTYIDETIPTTLPDVLTVTWTPHNQTPQAVSADGRCTLTPLCLTAAVSALDTPSVDDESFANQVLRPSLCLHYQDGTTLQDTADTADTADSQEDSQADSQLSAFGTLSADWADSVATISALPAPGTLFRPEDVTSLEVLGTTFSMEQP